LEDLSRIPSVSLETLGGLRPGARRCAAPSGSPRCCAPKVSTVEIIREGGQPAVIGHIDGPPGAPTVTLYAHHDVQPAGDPALAGTATRGLRPEVDGRLYGRGVADDKAGITAHLAALRAHAGNCRSGSPSSSRARRRSGPTRCPTILARHGHKLAADAIILADSGNWEIGLPALTTTCAGMLRAVVTVQTLDHGVHSGMFGGACPDALTALIRLLATLHDDEGNVARRRAAVEGHAADVGLRRGPAAA
jgi:acetylornithine deacetylase/succinyl-diaminopimelate desuccinylase-like protein